ncbi:CopD family protein [Ectothiorhodospiraceae bacterium WFHF3C12]|nr:CopD family protein [Ectothiorhodospiraceae bacterium WFHF3C12]
MGLHLPFALLLHLLAAVIWIGGMFFAYLCLRPAVGEVLAGIDRARLWAPTLRRFFGWVWLAVIVLPVTGYWMGYHLYGGMAGYPIHVHVMHGLGWLMIVLFALVYLLPFRRLQRAVASGDAPNAGASIGWIRRIVAVNLALGLFIVLVVSLGRYIPFL